MNKELFKETYPQNDIVTQMKYESLKNTLTLWKNNEHIGINDLMEKRLEIQRWNNVYPNGLDGVHNELKSVNRFVISELKKQLNGRGLVMVDVELIGSHKNWRNESYGEGYRRFVCFIPKEVCGSKENITFFICTQLREVNEDLNENYKGYQYVEYLDWLKDVKIELKNPLQSEVLEPIFGTDKFLWINPNQMMTMKDFQSKRYCELYDEWYSDDEEYMKGISERDKMLCDEYGRWEEYVHRYNQNKDEDRDMKKINKWLKEEMNIEVSEDEE